MSVVYMAKKKKSKKHLNDWAEAKRRCRLNQETIRMAKELGMPPRSLIKNIPSRSQQWKAPVHVWVRDLYEERMAKQARKRTNKERQARAAAAKESTPANTPAPNETVLLQEPMPDWEEWEEGEEWKEWEACDEIPF